MFMICHLPKFQMCSSIDSLVIAIELNSKYRFPAVTIVLYILQKKLPE
jgi:hypothetical protein